MTNNKVDADKAAVRVRLALRKLIASNKVVAAAADGKKGAGLFKLAAAERKEKKTKRPAKKAAKMPNARKEKDEQAHIEPIHEHQTKEKRQVDQEYYQRIHQPNQDKQINNQLQDPHVEFNALTNPNIPHTVTSTQTVLDNDPRYPTPPLPSRDPPHLAHIQQVSPQTITLTPNEPQVANLESQ